MVKISNESKIKGYEEKVKIAVEAVKHIKEPFKTQAFDRILDDLLKSGGGTAIKESKEQADTKSQSLNKTSSDDFDPSLFNGPDNFIHLGWREKLLYILDWANDNYKEIGLTTREIVQIFNQRYAQPYINSTIINKEMKRRLLRSPYIRPIKEGKNYRWFISPQGKEYIRKYNLNIEHTAGQRRPRTSRHIGRKSSADEETMSLLKGIPPEKFQDVKKKIESLDKKGKVLACLNLIKFIENCDGITTAHINRCLLEIFRVAPLNAGTLSNLVKALERKNLIHSKVISSGKRPVRKYFLLEKGEEKLDEKLGEV